MIVTINTDASFHPEYKFGTYAFWIVCDKFKITKSGYFKDKCLDPNDAEMKCIINALYTIKQHASEFNTLVINTDSMNSIHMFTKDFEKIKRYKLSKFSSHGKKFSKLIKELGRPKFHLKHVKAHTEGKDSRSYVNNWCDTEAKKELRKIIKKLSK